MYTVGEVAKCLGLSKDTLKFYEEKNLVSPQQDKENGYRKYNIMDINNIITVNFYRDIDIEIKKIQEIMKGDSVEKIETILDEKQNDLEKEIKYKTELLNRTKMIRENYKSFKENFNKFIIKEMKPIVVVNELIWKDEIKDIYNEILEKYDSSIRFKKAVNLSGISRIVHFDDKNVTKERYVFYEKAENNNDVKREVFSYPKCIYTVIAVPILNEEQSVDENMASSFTEEAKKLGYETLGIAFINILFSGYQEGQNTQYLEIYTPVK